MGLTVEGARVLCVLVVLFLVFGTIRNATDAADAMCSVIDYFREWRREDGRRESDPERATWY